MKRLFAIFLTVLAGVLVAGCASTGLIESDVNAFHRWNGAPPAPGTLYRFERLPSQQASGMSQDYLESLSRAALARVGLQLDPPVARLGVQVGLSTVVMARGPYDGGGFGFITPGIFLGGGSRGASFGLSLPLRFAEPPFYRRELTLLMRDLASGQVVFETRALSDSVQDDLPVLLPAMLESALRGFPQPPSGIRRISVDLSGPAK